MGKLITSVQLQKLLETDGELKNRLSAAVARLAAPAGAKIDDRLLGRALEELGYTLQTEERGAAQGKVALEDEELESVAGGRILFTQDGVNRNSWFVSLLSMLLAQDENRPAQAQSAAPRTITIDGKAYQIRRSGSPGNYYYVLEELP